MNEKRNGTKTIGKTALGAALMIAACTVLFNGLAEEVLAAEFHKTEQVPTSYSAAPLSTAGNALPEGYQKSHYTVVSDPLFKESATSKDLSMEEAAELGAQGLWEVFGVDLEGATVYMGYSSGTETFPRASWIGDVRFGPREKPDGTPGNHGYYFTLDAVTGERFLMSRGRTLPVDVPLGLDMSLHQNPGEYEALAKETAEQFGFVHGDIEETVYNGQGYSDNDPSISVSVTGANGEKALMTFSRYDKKLMGVAYDSELKIGEAASKKLLEEVERRVEEQRAKDNESSPNLVGLS